MMVSFAAQYLEDGPGVQAISPGAARDRLRSAFARLPISNVLIGWNLPDALLDACREESARAGARLWRWHPHPSPASDPSRLLACFCEDCYRVASAGGLDLDAVRRRIESLLVEPERVRQFLQLLLDPHVSGMSDPDLVALRAYLDFRARGITRFVREVCRVIRAEGLAVGLDCFSPAIAWMVGQDLGALDACCDWIKIMSYGHTLGPAGLPFELLDMADWLIGRGWAGEREALEWLSQASRLPLPPTRAALRQRGLLPDALAKEVRRARAEGISTLLAGIELVEIADVAELQTSQIEADLRAFREGGADGHCASLPRVLARRAAQLGFDHRSIQDTGVRERGRCSDDQLCDAPTNKAGLEAFAGLFRLKALFRLLI
jgi:hypothetical protein